MRSLWLAVCVTIATACSAGPSPSRPSDFANLRVAPTMHSYHLPGLVGLPVSAVQVGDGYLFCDQAAVYHLVTSGPGYQLRVLARPAVRDWNPSGLAYQAGVIVVANGLGHDVLKLVMNGDTLSLVQRITDPEMRRPQSVALGVDGSIAVADPEGSGVLRFGPDGVRQWRLSVGEANGVAESGGFIYATSLVQETIDKLDLGGHLLKTIGSAGASIPHFLWPLGVSDLGDQIAVTDAVQGRITLLDHDLRPTGHAGANGPGMDAFNFPRATLGVKDGYLIVDTYKRRLIHTDRNWTVLDQVAFGPAVPVGRERPLVFGVSDTRPYTYQMLPGVDVPAALGLRPALPFVGAYDGFDHLQSSGGVDHLDMMDRQFGSANVSWAQWVGQDIVIGSPESPQLLVVDPATGMFSGVDVGLDSWWWSGTLLLGIGLRRDLSEVVKPAQTAFTQADQLLAQGATPQQAFNQALSPGQPRDFAADLSSPGGREFLQSAMTSADANKYFAWAMQQPRPRVIEMLEVRYLSWASAR